MESGHECCAELRVISPDKRLRPFVRYYYVLRCNVRKSVPTFPLGCTQMIFHRRQPLYIPQLGATQPKFTVSGQTNFPADIVSGGDTEMIVAVFRPYTIGLFTETPPSEFYNEEIDGCGIGNGPLGKLADRVISADSTGETIWLVEHYLLSKLGERLPRHIDRIANAVARIFESPSVRIGDIAGEVCMGKKQFERVFCHHVGMMPKEYARIVRFQKTLLMMQSGVTGYADIAFAAGYSDQSHFIREFKKFAGCTPERLTHPYSDLFSVPV